VSSTLCEGAVPPATRVPVSYQKSSTWQNSFSKLMLGYLSVDLIILKAYRFIERYPLVFLSRTQVNLDIDLVAV
jgi:hypothetical protein